MFETSTIEIDRKKYASNLKFLRKTVASKSELCLVIKGNGYGHGARQIMEVAQDLGESTFAVFNAAEALDVLSVLNKDSRLIIMGEIDFPQLEWAMENNVEFFVHNLTLLQKVLETAPKSPFKAKVHLEVETGMNRLGIDPRDFHFLANLLNEFQHKIEVMGVCTHLAGAESITNFVRVKKQLKEFDRAVQGLRNLGIESQQIHAACSAGAIRLKKTRYDMVRIGILQYGFWPSQETFIEYIMDRQNKVSPLQRIITWKSRVMSLKAVPMGQYVGYGTSFLAEADKVLATVPVGYADGFSRSLSNQGRVLVRGKLAPVAGIVNMNAISVDITDIPGVEIGDEVVLIGTQEDQAISVSSFSDYSSQLNYELLTRLPKDIPRIIV
ncbi:alanine racemase [Pseudobacteriovorax antillogorgiicola]|uniref:Alanine racemase n=1 Tax=Pseudobacteriovorax antillogorgiicola TaxID=1513793 RepID=A0A1Y6BJ85_9BACT|nr:alanine racemase [Pseudobacteriovorax antillogorgiicola]TCS55582.1 alanine racemase [Pseudobacteriovorax antillogorgiicola]SMF10637.1 alanine racemase [Pseudobacteriovorax antillogorgiicola]